MSIPYWWNFFHRLCTILFDYFRFMLLASAAGHTNDSEVRKSIKAVMTKCYVGDWFVLNQLSKIYWCELQQFFSPRLNDLRFLLINFCYDIYCFRCRQLESSKYLVSVLDSKCDIEVSASLDQSNNLCYLISEVYSQKCLIQSANLNRYSSG